MSCWKNDLKTSLGIGNLYCKMIANDTGEVSEFKYVDGKIFRKDSYEQSWRKVYIVKKTLKTANHNSWFDGHHHSALSSSRRIFIDFCYHWRSSFSVCLNGNWL